MKNKVKILTKSAFLVICALLLFSCSEFLDWLLEPSTVDNSIIDIIDDSDDNIVTYDYAEIDKSSEFLKFKVLPYPKVIHYGANLGIFPPKTRDWIINTAFTKVKMEGASMRDSTLKAWWSEDNNSILFEASYTVAQGYVGAGTRKTWGTGAKWGGSSTIFNTYGQYAYYQTSKFKYDYSLYANYLLKTDPVYKEIIDYAKELCDLIEYDWKNFSGYTGADAVRTPGKQYEVCSGYANKVSNTALEQLDSVIAVQYWSSTGHAWNVLELADGRSVYFDLTWFDNEHINHDTGVVYKTDDYGWTNITFVEHLFRFSNIGYGAGIFHHDIGKKTGEKIRNK